MKKLGILLFLFSFSVLSLQGVTKNKTEVNKVDFNKEYQKLKDASIGEQFISINKSYERDSVGYTFIDKNSVRLHPYNKNIRQFNKVTNYIPSLNYEQINGNKVPYHSMVIQEFANCDKMEIAEGNIQIYANYFGDGKLISENQLVNRWVATNPGTDMRVLLVIACSLPLVN